MIGIDWGTSSFRAYRLAADGRILDRVAREAGILAIPAGGFPAALEAAIGPWLAAGERRVLLCGMVGSRQGWVEAPYLPCPAGPAEIAAALTRIPYDQAELLLVPGLSTRDAGGVPDVMRGEETKLIGLLAALGSAPALACLPGTHSKWARLEGGRIAGFATQMTGELRAVLLAHSILGRMAEEGPTVEAAFRRGVRRAGEAGGLLHQLFGTRGLGLMGELLPAETSSYLSGLLIGHELRAVLAEAPPAGPIHLAGAEALAAAYALAFAECGLDWRMQDPDLAAHGLHLIAETLA
ncbi:2-dehydro-3-deoxygalactonokinase [Siccirubricoccus sp. KC 17139]|uniref:2-dehydro-3-deoxygalactonokinase n=1 Tax=Siccirubricoccus soli TaxID=2899147 RepID=A0ABT1D3R4_9PROT|nr:2-dehydro-3-deoxygalactonokinase [Siccirubricoccus soli]MCO6415915.1 2-dehydro-3-deoxygalactonokinase [Siccirubricoccus soli]MCP2682047.1 2-dehydro-3-deoxygalactonokinase [Siccirubricoccus soli]